MRTFEIARINSSLRLGAHVTGALVLTANARAKKCFTGQNLVNAGFFLTPEEAREMIAADARIREVVWPCWSGAISWKTTRPRAGSFISRSATS